jgi:hypothetical protein
MKPDTAIRKRTQISKANRTMFLWIAGASAIVGFALVAAIFLSQKLIFNEKLLIEKNKTVSTLEANIAAVPELKSQVSVLDTNSALEANKANEDDQTLQVILDALPSEANLEALGASLQNRLLAGVSGLRLESLQVDPAPGSGSVGGNIVAGNAVTAVGDNQITFRFSVSGSQTALRQALRNLERSIRTIDVTSLQIESQGSSQVMTVQGRAFYEPAREVTVYEKVVNP